MSTPIAGARFFLFFRDAARLPALLAALAFGLLAGDVRSETVAEALAAGDRAYAQRGEKNDGLGHADPKQIERAIAAYRRAYAEAPANIEAAWKLMAALFFAGDFAAPSDEAAKAWFETSIISLSFENACCSRSWVSWA